MNNDENFIITWLVIGLMVVVFAHLAGVNLFSVAGGPQYHAGDIVLTQDNNNNPPCYSGAPAPYFKLVQISSQSPDIKWTAYRSADPYYFNVAQNPNQCVSENDIIGLAGPSAVTTTTTTTMVTVNQPSPPAAGGITTTTLANPPVGTNAPTNPGITSTGLVLIGIVVALIIYLTKK